MDVFEALADPVRRTILEHLHQQPLTVNALAERFPISRPATSRHLRVLREAELVSVVQEGRTLTYRCELKRLAEVSHWISIFEDGWSKHFDALETEVYRTRFERERTEASTRDLEGNTSQPISEEESA